MSGNSCRCKISPDSGWASEFLAQKQKQRATTLAGKYLRDTNSEQSSVLPFFFVLLVLYGNLHPKVGNQVLDRVLLKIWNKIERRRSERRSKHTKGYKRTSVSVEHYKTMYKFSRNCMCSLCVWLREEEESSKICALFCDVRLKETVVYNIWCVLIIRWQETFGFLFRYDHFLFQEGLQIERKVWFSVPSWPLCLSRGSSDNKKSLVHSSVVTTLSFKRTGKKMTPNELGRQKL